MKIYLLTQYGGEGGIRTPGRFDPTSDFKSGALNQALPPLRIEEQNNNDVSVACKAFINLNLLTDYNLIILTDFTSSY